HRTARVPLKSVTRCAGHIPALSRAPHCYKTKFTCAHAPLLCGGFHTDRNERRQEKTLLHVHTSRKLNTKAGRCAAGRRPSLRWRRFIPRHRPGVVRPSAALETIPRERGEVRYINT
ncbi:unnamed protein product, partial [Ectocarpus sp. 13 AM-2016]